MYQRGIYEPQIFLVNLVEIFLISPVNDLNFGMFFAKRGKRLYILFGCTAAMIADPPQDQAGLFAGTPVSYTHLYLRSMNRDNLYLINESVLAVAEYQGDTLFLADLFSQLPFAFDQVVGALLTEDEMQVEFGFTPLAEGTFEVSEITDDEEALFTLPCVELQNERFPILSHA